MTARRDERGPSVTAIVPVRDGEAYLAEAIDSILAQTRPADQVIVFDDGSSDGSVSVARSYGDSVECIEGAPLGVGQAIDRAFAAADGDVVAFLDADDLWTPDKLELQAAALEADRTLDMVFGHAAQFISPDLTELQVKALRPPIAAAPAKVKGTMAIRREAFAGIGRYHTEGITLADFIAWYARAAEAGLREAMLDRLVLRRRIHMTNSGRTMSSDRSQYARVMAESLRRRRSR